VKSRLGRSWPNQALPYSLGHILSNVVGKEFWIGNFLRARGIDGKEFNFTVKNELGEGSVENLEPCKSIEGPGDTVISVWVLDCHWLDRNTGVERTKFKAYKR